MGTKNPGKIEGARQAFEKYFDSVEIEYLQNQKLETNHLMRKFYKEQKIE